MSKRTYGWNAFESNLATAISQSDSTITLNTTVGLRAPGYLVIDPENPLKREFIRFTGISANALTDVARGQEGSSNGAQAHTSGVIIRAVPVHQWIDDLFDDIESLESDVSDLEAFETSHQGGTDTADHPEATVSTRGFMSASDKTKLDGIESGAEANPSASELLTSIKTVDGAASGLDADLLDGNHASEFSLSGHTHDHGSLTGLGDNDHPQYALTGHTHPAPDHGALTGLGDNDHPQYLLNSAHTKAVHDALGINAGSVDGLNASEMLSSGFLIATNNVALTGSYQTVMSSQLVRPGAWSNAYATVLAVAMFTAPAGSGIANVRVVIDGQSGVAITDVGQSSGGDFAVAISGAAFTSDGTIDVTVEAALTSGTVTFKAGAGIILARPT